MLIASRAIVGEFYRKVAQNPPDAWWDQIGWYQRSDQEAETYAFLGQAPGMREWQGERLMAALREDKITIHNVLFESSFRASVDDLRRDKTGQYLARSRDLAARASWQHWHKLLSPLIVEGDTTTYGLAYDGQKFFDTDHSIGSSGTIKNDLTSTEVSQLNVGSATAPTSSEMALAILGTINYMRRWNDDQNEPANEDATGFLIMVPANLAGPAESAAFDQNLLDANNAIINNPLKSRGLNLRVAMNPRILTLASGDDDVFHVFRTDSDVKPMILQEDLPPEMTVLDENSEEAFKTNNVVFGAKASRNVGYGEWLYAARATLS